MHTVMAAERRSRPSIADKIEVYQVSPNFLVVVANLVTMHIEHVDRQVSLSLRKHAIARFVFVAQQLKLRDIEIDVSGKDFQLLDDRMCLAVDD